METEKKLFHFLTIAKTLNDQLKIKPVLYGSLGLQVITGYDFAPDDIDVLVPNDYINEKWGLLRDLVEKSGYELFDLHEHEFRSGELKLAFAAIENLSKFANVDYKLLQTVDHECVEYQILSLEDYLKVYTQCLQDNYRKVRKSDKDEIKIKKIKELLLIKTSHNKKVE